MLQTERAAHATHSTDVTGWGRATSLASRLRFCAIAASVNSNCAPLGPRRRNRSSRRMRLRCANSISTFLRSQHECANTCVLASARATSRAASFTSRLIRRAGMFGQHFALSGQARHSGTESSHHRRLQRNMSPENANHCSQTSSNHFCNNILPIADVQTIRSSARAAGRSRSAAVILPCVSRASLISAC